MSTSTIYELDSDPVSDKETVAASVDMESIERLARVCDTMCLQAGTHLGEAVPCLNDLSTHFCALAAMLESETIALATHALEKVAVDINAIGLRLTSERESLDGLIRLNHLMSRRVVELADDVRFLTAMVSNVKIEVATIDYEGERLNGFAQNLETLANKSQSTLDKLQDTHKTLLDQLKRAVLAQQAFEISRQPELVKVAHDISLGLTVVSDRRQTLAAATTVIGATAQEISMRIAYSVVALQIGDSTRQRIEHAHQALSAGMELLAGRMVDGLALTPDEKAPNRALARLSSLQAIQLVEAAVEFSSDVATIRAHLDGILDAVDGLVQRSDTLFGSIGNTERSFLGDLERNLDAASDLIEQSQRARVGLDHTADMVVAAVLALEQLAASVAAMAVDMTIFGTNAIVTSYRLGTRGAGLSIIAQHLRGHAVRIADSVRRLKPVLDDVLSAAKDFAAARQGLDATTMASLATTMSAALGSFKSCDNALGDMRKRVAREALNAETTLKRAARSLTEVGDVDTRLHQAATDAEHIATGISSSAEANDDLDLALDRFLRSRYTMTSERSIHDAFFSREPAEAAKTVDPELSDMLF